MQSGPRSIDIYERLPHYPEPPLPFVPPAGDLRGVDACGVRLNAWSAPILRMAMGLTGFSSFWRALPGCLDSLLRRTNIRGPRLCAPVYAATVALEDDPRNLTPAARAATLVAGAYELYRSVVEGRLAPDDARGKPVEMGQYLNLFATNVVFDGKRPRIFKSARTPKILIMSRGGFYLIPFREPERMVKALARVWALSCAERGGEASPAILTSAEDSLQVREMPRLARHPINRNNFDELRHVFLTLCLDFDSYPRTFAEAARLAHSGNLGNRWQYSSLQLVVFGNAKASAIYNFGAYLDGNTMTRGAAEIQKNAAGQHLGADSQDAPAPIAELRWSMPRDLPGRAYRSIRPILDPQQSTFEIPGVGAEMFRAENLAAAPAFVVALQMAVASLAPEPASITQFLTASRYRCMGLVRADVSTPEVLRFVAHHKSASPEEARRLLDEAVRSQLERCRQARGTLGFDDVLSLFLESSRGPVRTYRFAAVGAVGLLLRALGLRRPRLPHILISHPTMFEGVHMLGRPGVRLPYLRDFGLHYHILHDRTIVTIMPSVRWKVSNAALVAALAEAFANIASILQNTRAASPITVGH